MAGQPRSHRIRPRSVAFIRRAALAAAALAGVLALWAVVPSAAAPPPNTWQLEVLYSPGGNGHRSALALQAGHVHVVFYDEAEKRVRYAHWRSLTQDWVLAEAAGPVVQLTGQDDRDVEIAVDPGQTAHVVYESDISVYYAYGDETGFHRDFIGDGRRPTVATTEANPVVAFIPWIVPGLGHPVTIATPNGNGWTYDAAFVGDLVEWQSLSLDQAGLINLAVSARVNSETAYRVFHVRKSGPGWSQTFVDFGHNPSVATDLLNHAHIAYSQGSELRYAELIGASWVTETVTTTVGTVTGAEVYPALGLGLADQPHLAFVDGEGLKYATKVAGVWQVSLLYDAGGTGLGEVDPFSRVDLAVDASGAPHLSFAHRGTDAAHLSGGPAWQSMIVDGSAPVAYTSIDASQSGQPRISYGLQAGPQRGLNYAAYETLGCSPPVCQTGWTYTPVALGGAGDRGEYNSLMLRGVIDGDPRVASYNPQSADLEYSFRTGTAWTTETVDSQGDVGRYADLELEATGQPWIAYWDHTNFRVKLAWKDPGGWHVVTDTVGPPLNAESGRLALALPLPSSGLCCAYISYYDGVNEDLRVARWDGSAWTDVLVAYGGDVGSLSAADFTTSSNNPQGDLNVLFYDAGQSVLRHGQWSPALNESSYFSFTAVLGAGSLLDLSELVTYNHGFGGMSVGFTSSGDNAVRVANGVYDSWRVDTLASGGPTQRRYVALDVSNYRLHATYAGADGELVYAISRRTLSLMGYNPLQPCLEDPSQALARLAAAPRVFAPLASAAVAAASDLDVLRAARDLFATDPDGQAYIALYYAHAAETGALAVADPGLAREAYDLLQDFLPGIEALVSARGNQITISQSMVDRANHLADALASAGSPALGSAIAAERAKYNNLQAFVGLSFEQAAALMGLPPPLRVYLPVVRR
jgi:hypothetical protein